MLVSICVGIKLSYSLLCTEEPLGQTLEMSVSQLCACLTVLSSSQQLGTRLSERSQWTVSWQESFKGYRQHELC